MSELKTLLQLWTENGKKPVDVIDRAVSLKVHVEQIITTPDGIPNAFCWSTSNNWIVLPANTAEWALFEVEEEFVPHYPALFRAGKSNGYFTSAELFSTEDEARKSLSNTFHKLLVEYPPVMLPRRK